MYAKQFEKSRKNTLIQTFKQHEPDSIQLLNQIYIIFLEFLIIKYFFSEPGSDAPKVEIVNYEFS